MRLRIETRSNIFIQTQLQSERGLIMDYSFHDAAKMLGIGAKCLTKKLREERILLPDNTPKQSFINRKLFRVSHRTFVHPAVGTRHYPKTFITVKGIDWLSEKLNLSKAEVQA